MVDSVGGKRFLSSDIVVRRRGGSAKSLRIDEDSKGWKLHRS